MHHLAAFYESLALSANYAAMSGVADGGLPRNSADAYILPSNMQVIGAFGQGATLSRLQIQAPSLRNIAYPEINPVQETAVDPAVSNANFRPYMDAGPRMIMAEAFQTAGSNSNGAAAVDAVAGVWIAPRFLAAPPGMITTLVATASVTLVQWNWALGTLAFETVLAAGEYAVVGMAVQCDDAVFGRLVFPGNTNLRPGVLAFPAAGGAYKWDQFRVGNFGQFGTFVFNAPPQIEVFGHTAGAQTATVFLDVVKTR